MKRDPREIAELRKQIRDMSLPQKAEYIITYYRLPIVLGLVAVLVLGSVLYRHFTQKETALYLGLANVSFGTDLKKELSEDFLAEHDLAEEEVLIYEGLYLSADPSDEDHQYAYASRMKLMATVTAEKFDVVIMNRAAYDLLSGEGYLLDLDSPALSPYLRENEVVLKDNSIEVDLGTAEERIRITETHQNAIELTTLPRFRNAGITDPIYAAIIGNTPRGDLSAAYLEYLLTEAQ